MDFSLSPPCFNIIWVIKALNPIVYWKSSVTKQNASISNVHYIIWTKERPYSQLNYKISTFYFFYRARSTDETRFPFPLFITTLTELWLGQNKWITWLVTRGLIWRNHRVWLQENAAFWLNFWFTSVRSTTIASACRQKLVNWKSLKLLYRASADWMLIFLKKLLKSKYFFLNSFYSL